jgi:ATP-dependent Lon protease
VRGPPVPMPLSAARALLDSQHTGLDKVKERIIEHLAVSRLLGPANMGQGRSPVLCLIGKSGGKEGGA